MSEGAFFFCFLGLSFLDTGLFLYSENELRIFSSTWLISNVELNLFEQSICSVSHGSVASI